MESIILRFEAVYYVDQDSVRVQTHVTDLYGPSFDQAVATRLHEAQRELLWEVGKAVSVSCSFQKAFSRWQEACSAISDPF